MLRRVPPVPRIWGPGMRIFFVALPRVPQVSLLRPGINASLVSLLSAAAFLAGCGMPGAPQPPSLNLPNPVTNLSAVRTGDQVALAFTLPKRTTDKVELKAPVTARVCRSETKATACNAIATLQFAPASEGAYTDALPAALASGAPRPLIYTVELVNNKGPRKGRSAGPSNSAVVLAGQAPGAVTGLTAEVRKDGVLLNWAPEPSDSTPVALRLVRTLLAPPAKKAGQGPLSAPAEPVKRNLLVASAASGRALDPDIHFGESYEYRAQRVAHPTVNGDSLELAGPLSEPIHVDAADIFPPSVPQGLAAVATAGENGNPPAGNSPSIDLNWQPVTDAGLAGYIVYRRDTAAGGNAAWQRISPAQPLVGPGFHDAGVAPGHTYTYVVSAIGQNGRESARSSETQETVPSP
jgi:hypothetical protein